MTQRILVVDDEPGLVELIAYNLAKHNFEVLTAPDGPACLRIAREQTPDLIVLDLMLPGMHGHDVCRELRRVSTVPIIMLTAQGEEIDRVLGLELGADDYLSKPFSMRELIARIKAVLRRGLPAGTHPALTTLHAKTLALDVETRIVRVAGQTLELTRIEFDLLHVLMASVERVYSREQLLEQVWGYQFFGDARAVDSAIKRLRAKVRAIDIAADGIVAVRGVGYKFSHAPEAQ